jgi:hypothetical protein
MSGKPEHSLYPVDPRTMQIGLVIEGSIADVGVVGHGYNSNSSSDWYVFAQNSEYNRVGLASIELEDLKERELTDSFVMGVGVSFDGEHARFNHERVGFWVQVEKGIRVIPTYAQELKVRIPHRSPSVVLREKIGTL